jgi:hypothetical protein
MDDFDAIDWDFMFHPNPEDSNAFGALLAEPLLLPRASDGDATQAAVDALLGEQWG